MQRSEFIDEMFSFFKCKDEDLKRAYDLAFTVKESIDWDKLYKIVINEAESRYLPVPKWFKDFFPRCIITSSNFYENDGLKVRVTLTDGYSYEYETFQNNLSLEELKQKFMNKFKDSFSSMNVYWESDNPKVYEYEWRKV